MEDFLISCIFRERAIKCSLPAKARRGAAAWFGGEHRGGDSYPKERVGIQMSKDCDGQHDGHS